MNAEDLLKDAGVRMGKSVEALQSDLAKIRTGRAHPSLLEHIMVNYYGSDMPLNQTANISVQDPRTLLVTAWDKSAIRDIEKAIMNSDLGLNPVSSGEVICVPLPSLTEDRRRELIKVVRSEGERSRVAIRNIRRDVNQHLKEMVKEKKITEDDERRMEDQVQKSTDVYIARVETMLEKKERDMMEV